MRSDHHEATLGGSSGLVFRREGTHSTPIFETEGPVHLPLTCMRNRGGMPGDFKRARERSVVWGVSALSHDSALAVFKDGALVFASQSERYSREKNDPALCAALVQSALRFGEPDAIVWHERPLARRARQLYAGQWMDAILGESPAEHLRSLLSHPPAIHYVPHHASHAAAGYYTSGLQDASIVVIDAIGEWATVSIWHAHDRNVQLRYRQSYPHSLGLFYSAMTQRCGLRPNEEEYILMGMAAFGDSRQYAELLHREFVHFAPGSPHIRLRRNLHRGCQDWRPDIENVHDLAAATQYVYEQALLHLTRWVRAALPSSNLVLAGGCALNCVANARVAASGDWDTIWIMPHPGDAGNSVGAVLAWWQDFIEWPGAYLGEEIAGSYPVAQAVALLTQGCVIGVANGRAEFGPRALGNRSLLCDPRSNVAKELVNILKCREQFRPFAPAIIAEECADYFDLAVQQSPYMQFVARCKRPNDFPAIVHVDGTSRVQTVSARDHAGFYALLQEWRHRTGCPMLLNTSLNIKGQPLVNDREQARQFSECYSVPVL
jgi:carbamoyltransferase